MSDDKFINHIQQTLDDDIDKLDASTLSRLNQARHKALESKHKNPFWQIIPAGALATVTVVILAGYLWSTQTQPSDQIVVNKAYNDLEILSSSTELDLLEDMDFVLWLVDEDAS